MPKEKDEKEKPLLSMRVNFPSAEQYVEDYLHQFVAAFQMDDDGAAQMKGALIRFLERFMFDMESALVLGATKGIEEALNLIRNPKYYEVVKERRKRDRERAAEYRKEQEEAKLNPPPRTKRVNLREQAQKVSEISSEK